MANGKVNGKQIIDDTVIKTINGLTFSDQYLVSTNDSNVTLSLTSSGPTQSFVVGWTGSLPLSRGGLNNTSFTASQILIVNSATSAVVSSGLRFNDSGTSSTDVWSANKIKTEISNSTQVVLHAGRSSNNSTGIYLRTVDGIPTNTTPYLIPFNSTLKYLTLTTNANSTWIGEVRIGGVAVTGATISMSATVSAYGTYSIDFNAGDKIQMYCNGTSVDNPLMSAFFVKR